MPIHRPDYRPPEYILKSSTILNCIRSDNCMLSDVAYATAFARTTVIRVVAVLVEDGIVEARLVDGDVQLSMVRWAFPGYRI